MGLKGRTPENSFPTQSRSPPSRPQPRKGSASYALRLGITRVYLSSGTHLIRIQPDCVRRQLHLRLVFCVRKMALLMASGTIKNHKDSRPEKDRPHSSEIFERGRKTLVGGVNSPVRAFRAVGGTPLIIDHAKGARLFDVDGREYIDFVCSWGALILGHAHADIVAAISDQAARGTSFGMTSPLEVELGEKITKAIPSVEMVRFVNSGTEAAMSAIRLARGFTR